MAGTGQGAANTVEARWAVSAEACSAACPGALWVEATQVEEGGVDLEEGDCGWAWSR